MMKFHKEWIGFGMRRELRAEIGVYYAQAGGWGGTIFRKNAERKVRFHHPRLFPLIVPKFPGAQDPKRVCFDFSFLL